jgi:hypothetical protein
VNERYPTGILRTAVLLLNVTMFSVLSLEVPVGTDTVPVFIVPVPVPVYLVAAYQAVPHD